MFSKKKEATHIDAEQRELYENARRRVIQKKRLFQHFIIFLVGSIFMIVLNLVLGLGNEIKIFGLDWFVIGILVWAFLLMIHAANVGLFHKFMGKEWENRQIERLIAKQKNKIADLQKKVAIDHPSEKVKNLQRSSSSDQASGFSDTAKKKEL